MKKIAMLLLLLLLAGCSVSEDGSIESHFCPAEDCEAILAGLIANAEESVACAFYSLGSDTVKEAISRIDVEKKIVFGDERKYPQGLMHNKFCVIDEELVFTGSFNPNGMPYKNNIVILESKYIARNYLAEFEELSGHVFGRGKKVKYPKVELGNAVVENYFCPEDDCRGKVTEVLEAAEESIYFFVFSFTDEEIADVLLEKDVVVRGIIESGQNSKWSVYDKLKDGIDVSLFEDGVMHNKVFVVDNKTVVTGSWNPTKNGSENNDENILIIHDEDIAMEYVREFEKWKRITK